MILERIRNSSSVGSALALTLIPALLLAGSLAVLGPGFGKTADPFITYLVLSLLASPFVFLGFIFAIFTETTAKRKLLTVALASVATLFAAWPILGMLLLLFTLKGPINPG